MAGEAGAGFFPTLLKMRQMLREVKLPFQGHTARAQWTQKPVCVQEDRHSFGHLLLPQPYPSGSQRV